jgi:hypothetical protein
MLYLIIININNLIDAKNNQNQAPAPPYGALQHFRRFLIPCRGCLNPPASGEYRRPEREHSKETGPTTQAAREISAAARSTAPALAHS